MKILRCSNCFRIGTAGEDFYRKGKNRDGELGYHSRCKACFHDERVKPAEAVEKLKAKAEPQPQAKVSPVIESERVEPAYAD